jgi:hypothetical protein
MSGNLSSDDEKKGAVASSTPSPSVAEGVLQDANVAADDDFEVFKKTSDGVDFRTVGWPRAAVIFLKG